MGVPRPRYSYPAKDSELPDFLCRFCCPRAYVLVRQTPSQLPVCGLPRIDGRPSSRLPQRRSVGTHTLRFQWLRPKTALYPRPEGRGFSACIQDIIMPDYTWEFDGITVDGLIGPTPTLTRGSGISVSLLFTSRGAANYVSRYESVLEYLQYANGAPTITGVGSTGVPWYRERLPTGADVSSLVVPLQPGADVEDSPGVWALVVGGSDASEPVGDVRRVELELFVLAAYPEFADRAAVQAAFEEAVI